MLIGACTPTLCPIHGFRRDQEEAERVHRVALEREEQEKAISLRVRTETAQEVSDRMGRENDKLRRLIADITDQKNKLEKLYMHKSQSDSQKAEVIRRMHEDRDKEKQLMLREGRKEMRDEIQARRDAEVKIKQMENEVRWNFVLVLVLVLLVSSLLFLSSSVALRLSCIALLSA